MSAIPQLFSRSLRHAHNLPTAMILSSFGSLNGYKLTTSSRRFLHNSTPDKDVSSNQGNSVHAQPTPKQLEGIIDEILHRKINEMVNAGLEAQNKTVKDRLADLEKGVLNRHISELNEEVFAKVSSSYTYHKFSLLDITVGMAVGTLLLDVYILLKLCEES
jgi:hypothetical protein